MSTFQGRVARLLDDPSRAINGRTLPSTPILWADNTPGDYQPLFVARLGECCVITCFIPVQVETSTLYLDQTYSIVRQFYNVNATIDDEAGTFVSGPIENPQRYAGRAVIIGGSPENNWYHWILNWLPRLVLVARLCPELIEDPSVRFVFHENVRNEPYRSMLNLFGLDEDRLIYIDPHPGVMFDDLIVPTMIDQNYYSAALCTACQDYFLRATAPDLSGALPKRIYISRENFTTPRRRVANYEEFKSVLQEFDITPVVLDGMSGIQQIQLLRNAEVVVGVHGAGLSNILFCPPECRIVILDNERNINVKMVGMFSGLASVLGLEHRVVKVGEESREGFDYENFHYLHNRDVIVDFDEFRRVMAETLADQKTRLTRSNDVSDCLFGTSTALSGSAGSTVAAPESGSRTAETPRTFMARWWKLLASR